MLLRLSASPPQTVLASIRHALELPNAAATVLLAAATSGVASSIASTVEVATGVRNRTLSQTGKRTCEVVEIGERAVVITGLGHFEDPAVPVDAPELARPEQIAVPIQG